MNADERRYGVERDIQQRLVRYIKSRPCTDCKGTFPPEVMEFDHRDPATKDHNVSAGPFSVKRFVIEIEKCDVVCANCHKLRTYSRR